MTDTDTTQVPADELRERIERVYVQITGGSNGKIPARGALSWFAERAKVPQKTVGRWVRGVHPISGPALALLEELETKAEREGSNHDGSGTADGEPDAD